MNFWKLNEISEVTCKRKSKKEKPQKTFDILRRLDGAHFMAKSFKYDSLNYIYLVKKKSTVLSIFLYADSVLF